MLEFDSFSIMDFPEPSCRINSRHPPNYPQIVLGQQFIKVLQGFSDWVTNKNVLRTKSLN